MQITDEMVKAAADGAYAELLSMAKEMNVPLAYTESICVSNYRVMRAALEAALTHGEPVAWHFIYDDPKNGRFEFFDTEPNPPQKWTSRQPLYTHAVPQPSGPVQVKPLEWKGGPDSACRYAHAQSAHGVEYRVWKHRDEDEWYWAAYLTMRENVCSKAPLRSEDEAMAAAQADYERRILSAMPVARARIEKLEKTINNLYEIIEDHTFIAHSKKISDLEDRIKELEKERDDAIARADRQKSAGYCDAFSLTDGEPIKCGWQHRVETAEAKLAEAMKVIEPFGDWLTTKIPGFKR